RGRQHAGRVSRLRACGRALSPLWNADREGARRRPRHVVLPEGSGGQPALALEAPEFGVTADRPAVDDDLRDRPAPGQIVELLPEGGIAIVDADLLEGQAEPVE